MSLPEQCGSDGGRDLSLAERSGKFSDNIPYFSFFQPKIPYFFRAFGESWFNISLKNRFSQSLKKLCKKSHGIEKKGLEATYCFGVRA